MAKYYAKFDDSQAAALNEAAKSMDTIKGDLMTCVNALKKVDAEPIRDLNNLLFAKVCRLMDITNNLRAESEALPNIMDEYIRAESVVKTRLFDNAVVKSALSFIAAFWGNAKSWSNDTINNIKDILKQVTITDGDTTVKPFATMGWNTSYLKTNVSQTFGNKSSLGLGYHLGVDLTGFSDIKPIFGGKVTAAGYSTTGGNYVIVEHNMNGKVFYSIYEHMAKTPSVQKDDVVEAGTVLGIMGSTGKSTATHLHLQVYTGGNGGFPYGYAHEPFSGNTGFRNGVTSYDPLKVIESGGAII